MLRVSSQTTNDSYDLSAILRGASHGDGSGVPHGAELLRFADAVVERDANDIAAARDQVTEVAGQAAMVDAAGVIANFHRMTRIADGTGIALDQRMLEASVDLRSDLGIDRFRRTSAGG